MMSLRMGPVGGRGRGLYLNRVSGFNREGKESMDSIILWRGGGSLESSVLRRVGRWGIRFMTAGRLFEKRARLSS